MLQIFHTFIWGSIISSVILLLTGCVIVKSMSYTWASAINHILSDSLVFIMSMFTRVMLKMEYFARYISKKNVGI